MTYKSLPLHLLPSYDEAKEDKIIVKLIRHDSRNEIYRSRKMVAGRKASSLESLTPLRKKLFGAVNKIKESYNGSTYGLTMAKSISNSLRKVNYSLSTQRLTYTNSRRITNHPRQI